MPYTIVNARVTRLYVHMYTVYPHVYPILFAFIILSDINSCHWCMGIGGLYMGIDGNTLLLVP